MTLKQHPTYNKKAIWISMQLGVILLLPIITIGFQNADASHCSTGSGNHCYSIERKTQTNYGNKMTVKVTNLSITGSCPATPNFATITNWVSLPNGDWLEIGYADGYTAYDGNCYNEYTYTAHRIGGNYQETKHSSVSVAATYVFEFSDTNKDGTWEARRDSTFLKSISIPYSNGLGADVGSELTQNNANAVPNTHITNIAMYPSTSWSYWTSADSGYPSAHNPPYWFSNCVPNYKHVHIGTTGYTQNCQD